MTKKFLVPLVLPADPVAAMEAATKQYVDSKGGGSSVAEVIISTTDPGTANTYLLWYDPDG